MIWIDGQGILRKLSVEELAVMIMINKTTDAVVYVTIAGGYFGA